MTTDLLCLECEFDSSQGAPVLSTNGDPCSANRTASVSKSPLPGGLIIRLLDDFVSYLTEHGVSLTELSRRESFSIAKQWTSVFATQSDDLEETQGLKAISKWLSAPEQELILLFLSAKVTAFPISENDRPCVAFRYAGPILDLSSYNELEFAVFPDSYQWTLVHTHEDGALGGPYFIRNRVAP